METVYIASNRTSTALFEDWDDACTYQGKCGVTAGIEITEMQVIPKGAYKEAKE